MEPSPKSILRSKTAWAAALLAVGSGLNAMAPYLDSRAASLVGMFAGFVFLALRFVTDRPVE